MIKVRSFKVEISRIIEAPLSFVYSWWTDFREDDVKISGQKRRVSILERTGRRVIMSVRYSRSGRPRTAARIVTLEPPDAWHLDWIGDEENETGDYRLRRLDNRRTKLGAVFKVKPRATRKSNKSKFQKNVNALWDKYVAALEKDYRMRS